MMAVSVWIGKVARVKNVDRAAATAMIRDDIENWGGLDKLYSVKWTAQAAAGGKYRVKARIHDLLGVRCGEKYLLRTAASALPGAGAARTEVHPFEIDLAAMTLRPLSPRAWMAVDFDAYSAWSRRRSAAGKRALGRDADARAFAPAYSRGSRGRVKLPAARPARKKPARKVRRRLKRKKPAKKKAAAPAPALPGLEGLLPPAKPAKKRPAKEPSPRGAIKKGDIREMSVEDFERYLRGGKP